MSARALASLSHEHRYVWASGQYNLLKITLSLQIQTNQNHFLSNFSYFLELHFHSLDGQLYIRNLFSINLITAFLKSINIQIVIKITIFKHSITVLVFINMNYYRHPCVATVADYVLLLFIFIFFIHRSFSETTRPILTKFSGIVYSGLV